jgi:hypothetical protein
MTERPHQAYRSGDGQARSGPPLPPGLEMLSDHTVPVPPVSAPREDEPAILGFPAEFPTGEEARPLADAPPVPTHLVVLRRPERLGGLALFLAAIAAGVSLWLPWWRGTGATGVSLVRHGVTVVSSQIGNLGISGFWQPLVVVLGGGVLFLLGLLLFRRARTHRVVGVLALLTALVASAGVVVPIADANWSTSSFGPGMWVATAVPVLGALGALKAMLTTPVVMIGDS